MELLWRIYYDDGSAFSSKDGSPEDAPAYGVICISFPEPLVGRQIMHRWDWYYWVEDDQAWWGSDIYGVLDRLLHNLPLRALKQGRNVSNEEYSRIMAKADKDPDFSPRSGKLAQESPTTYGS